MVYHYAGTIASKVFKPHHPPSHTRLYDSLPTLASPILVLADNMSKNTSYMLDSMIAAVDNGFSYDGIVSVPDAGLEDARFGRADVLRENLVSSLSTIQLVQRS